ncbi:MAG TPA: dephospho-CoA kinase [Gemmatimonadales bacterium]|nr:dephospho-CoA kinase [Gemmatimonadales bacterium]
MLSVALTGNIGAGKSTVADLFRRWGATIIDADTLVREAQAPGHPGLGEIAGRFGRDLIRGDGSLDRARLRTRVLRDPAELQALNRIMHPLVHQRRRELLAQARIRGDRIVVSDIPLLFEASDPREFDAVVLVDAPEQIRRARLIGSRDMPVEDIDRLMAAQLASADKRSRSDYVIENAGDRQALERSAAIVWQALLARA